MRVSSKEQEKEGFSIPAQKDLLNKYALERGIQIVKVFEESESAKSIGRPQFKAMLKYLEDNRETAQHLLVEKTDRLYRNFKDYSLLDPAAWPHLNIHLVKENEILSKDSKAHQKLIHGLKVLLAKNYIDNLSEEVKKGMNQKASEGRWPSNAPIGYINVKRDKNAIEPDPEKAPVIRRAFELASTGQYSLTKLARLLFNEGLRSARSKSEFSKSQMQRVLSNPIYYGDFVWNGNYYKGIHTPIVDKSLFNRVQIQMGLVKRSKSSRYNFAFTNIMKCSHCGCAITAEEKRKRSGRTYVYYHCTSGKGQCLDRVYIREEKINEWITEALSEIKIPDHIVEWTKQAIMESHRDEQAYHMNQIRILEDRYRTTQKKVNSAYEDKLEDRIDFNFWTIQNERLNKELIEIEGQLESLRKINSEYNNKGLQLMEFAKQAATLFQNMTPDEKRELVNLVLSNPQIESGSLRYDYKKPFSMFRGVTNLGSSHFSV